MQDALRYWQEGLDEVKRDLERYAFLVYNASIYLWNICRPVLRIGFARELIKSHEEIVSTMMSVNTPQFAWRVQTIINYVRCLEDGGKMDDAIKQINAAKANK